MPQQIVIFSAQGCKYCEKAKLLLKEHNPTIFDVDVSPQRYQQAAAFTKSSTVPLIFVGTEYIGGSSELEQKKEYVFQKINNDQNDVADSEVFPPFLRLTLSDEEKQIQTKKNAKLDEEINFLEHNSISELQIQFRNNNTSFSYSEILEYLRYDASTCVVLEDRGGIIFGKRPKTTTGKDLFDACKKFVKSKVIKISDDDNTADSSVSTSAIEMMTKLLSCRMIYNAEEPFTISTSSPESANSNNSKITSPSTFLRFAFDASEVGDFSSFGKFVLNSDRNASTTFVAKNSSQKKVLTMTGTQAVSLSRALWRSQNQLMSGFRDEKSGLVDYEGELHNKILENPFRVSSFAKFKQLASLLQFVDLSLLTDTEKICFGINLYNTLVYVGFAECFVPWSTFQKMTFFGQVGVFIGFNKEVPLFFSLNDIENGLLRGNRKGLTDVFGCPFSSSDPRFALPVKRVDYRIHFGLNCGAKSCPPVKLFSIENLHQELEMAATAFIQSTSKFDQQKNVIVTSQILKWYRVDFDGRLPQEDDECGSKEIKPEQNVQSVVLKYLGVKNHVSKKLEDIDVDFAEYDWSFDAKPKK